MSDFTILTVCTGNICRSPLAQQLIRAGLSKFPAIQVDSAGTGALVGHAMPDEAQDLARGFGISNPELHSAKALTAQQLREADLVIALSREHRRMIVEMFPRGARHTFTLREFERLVKDLDEQELSAVQNFSPSDLSGRLLELVEIVAGRRGTVPPPTSPDDDDVIDPYRRDDEIYQLSASQIVPAVEALVKHFDHATDSVRG